MFSILVYIHALKRHGLIFELMRIFSKGQDDNELIFKSIHYFQE